MAAFEHVMGRYQRDRASKPVTVAALLAFATNMGLGRMAEISNLTRDQLATTAANFIRLETLREANDRIANATARLPIFRHFDIGDAVHSSSDGQKFESALPTVNARHSAKYFGLKKGVVAYTLLASHVPLSARIIGANEHESHYVFDVLFNNLCDIQPETHSTDTHGANQVTTSCCNSLAEGSASLDAMSDDTASRDTLHLPTRATAPVANGAHFASAASRNALGSLNLPP